MLRLVALQTRPIRFNLRLIYRAYTAARTIHNLRGTHGLSARILHLSRTQQTTTPLPTHPAAVSIDGAMWKILSPVFTLPFTICESGPEPGTAVPGTLWLEWEMLRNWRCSRLLKRRTLAALGPPLCAHATCTQLCAGHVGSFSTLHFGPDQPDP